MWMKIYSVMRIKYDISLVNCAFYICVCMCVYKFECVAGIFNKPQRKLKKILKFQKGPEL